jgi:LSD1 subclass zinc finger protein
MATRSEKCGGCGARNWTIYRNGDRLTIRCADCDSVEFICQVESK